MTTLDATALRHLLAGADGPQLIDVRTPAEFETAHIPGSCNVPLDVLREHRDELRARLDERVVLICRSGQRAAMAEEALAAAGLPHLRVLRGGINAWQAVGAPIRTGKQKWDLERQVRLVAGAIVLATILASAAFPPAKWLAAVVGAGLAVAALTNTCLRGMALAKLPYNRGPRTDVDGMIAALAGSRP